MSYKKAIAFLIVIGIASFNSMLIRVSAQEWHVGGVGEGNYTSIQDAIDDSYAGDTIYVHQKVYNETIYIDKSLTIIGLDQPTINGGNTTSIVTIKADNVIFTNFELIEAGQPPPPKFHRTTSGIFLEGSHCNISYITFGVNGSMLSSFNNSHNSFSHLTFTPNYLLSGGGIYLQDSNNNEIFQNAIYHNPGNGIHVCNSTSNEIYENYIEFNYRGIFIQSSSDGNTIYNNTIFDCYNCSMKFLLATGNTVIHNNLIFDREGGNIYDHSINYYDKNYWSDYDGNDTNQDGYGDTPYEVDCFFQYGIPCQENYDYSPLMQPHNESFPPWDINQDGFINFLDASMLLACYGQSGPPGWIPEDINEDGFVNYLDSSILVDHYGE